MISIGLVSGPRSSVFEEQCRIALKLFETKRKEIDSSGLVNVVFHSPLSLMKADFTGMKTGAFSKEKREILVAIAVPLSVTDFETADVVSYIHKQLHEAADFGIDFLEHHQLEVQRAEFHEFIDDTMLCL
ncbi:MAG: hypothetical protein ACIAZJ_22100 [Gimesia chilikensis]|uniref:hypothetical protein n=1 Tax=Gimesia chilikensis TaxID=2605989 RepID=UPI0037931B0F